MFDQQGEIFQLYSWTWYWLVLAVENEPFNFGLSILGKDATSVQALVAEERISAYEGGGSNGLEDISQHVASWFVLLGLCVVKVGQETWRVWRWGQEYARFWWGK